MTSKIYFDYFMHYSYRSYFENSKTHPCSHFLGTLPADHLRIPSPIKEEFYDPYLLVLGTREEIGVQLTKQYEPLNELLWQLCTRSNVQSLKIFDYFLK